MLLLQGIVLLITGIGIVFVFLTLLVSILNLSAKIVPRFNHILPDEEIKAKPRSPAPASCDDEAIAVAIAIAAARQRDSV